MNARRALLLSFVSVTACAGGAMPTMKGRQGMMDETGVKQKCAEAAQKEQRPFVVDWDATDISSFERKATRDTVFVHYAGCELEILPQCQDPDRAAALGSYASPTLSTGGIKQVDIKNEGELYAKLPLGAASFSGKVAAGEELHLKYFVTGEAATTRESVYRGELAKYPGCERATHYVYAYNVGAFELSTSERGSGEVNASYAGVGAGGKRSSEASRLGKVGNIESCTTNDQRECRAPIRLTLRAISEGDAPDGGGAGAQTAVIGGSVVDTTKPFHYSKTVSGAARGNLDEARKKLEARDGASCMRLIDKAITHDKQLASSDIMQVRALCQMLVGECEPGAKAYRAAIVATDKERQITDADLDKRVANAKGGFCPASSAAAGNDAEFFDRAMGEAGQAYGRKDVGTCKSLFAKVEQRASNLGKDKADLRQKAAGAMGMASQCVLEHGSCKEGRPYWIKTQTYGGLDPKTAEATFDNGVKQQAFRCK